MSVYPFDIVKSVIQNSDGPLTVRKAFRDNYTKYGYKFFLKGAAATSAMAVPMEAT